MRIRTILAAGAVPAALAATLLGTAGAASAAATGAVTITSQAQADTLVQSGVIAKNIDVPQGVSISLGSGVGSFQGGLVINGNVTVEGQLALNGVTVNGNVTVSDNADGAAPGSASQLSLFNNPSHITRNLTVTGSAGGDNGNGNRNGTSFADNADQPWGPTPVTQIDGNFTFTGNTGWLYVGAPVHVNGNFTANGNGPYTWGGAFNYGGVSAAKTSVVPPTYNS